MGYSMVGKKKIHYLCEDKIETLSLASTVCLPNSESRNRFFYPTLTLIIDSYRISSGL